MARNWSKEEDQYIIDNVARISFNEIARHLNSSASSIRRRAVSLGVELDCKHKKWTEEEIELLKEIAPYYPAEQIAKKLQRTVASVKNKAVELKININCLELNLSNEDLQYIKNNWGKIPVNEMARVLKSTRKIIQSQADKMNLPKLGNNPYKKWTDENIAKLKELAKTKSISELARRFHTTNRAITTIASKNNIKLQSRNVVWTEKEIQTLRELATTMDLSELALAMDRSYDSIRYAASRYNIEFIKNKNIWTKADEDMLISLAKEGKTLVEIAILMNKYDKTISEKANQLNIKITKEERHQWTKEEIEKLRELAKTKTISELVAILKRTSYSLKAVAKRNDIQLIYDRKKWTEEEYQLLEKLIIEDKKTPKEIASILGRSEISVITKIYDRNLNTEFHFLWTEEEEQLLSDLWGEKSIDYIAQKLNRTASAILQKANSLGLESFAESNYNGISLVEISRIFKINIETVSITWISLGLNVKKQKFTSNTSYRYVTIDGLLEFLKNNQNIWDSRNLEKNILGKEPEWLIEKRKKDIENDFKLPKLYLEKQKLLLEQQKIYNEEDNKTLQKK